MGVDPAQGRRDGMDRAVTDDLVDSRRHGRAVCPHALGAADGRAWPRAADRARHAAQQTTPKWTYDVLLPVSGARRSVLRRTAVLVGRARPLGRGDRRT